MNLSCPECSKAYRIDPARVPEGGASTRCRECGTAFIVEGPDTPPGVIRAAQPVASGATGSSEVAQKAGGRRAPVFGPQDPDTRAERLARALVSDIVVYNRERWEESRSAGTLRTDFREEILKSWDEYVEQVGEEMARKTPYFRDALNAILAEGGRVF
ncbi:MAG TPA: zinc-ribbon domain-containing protein [Longimicrobiales bacterium]|nr:zinc-ribbon domain-containing protein [Longimicrobiales bacterium]